LIKIVAFDVERPSFFCLSFLPGRGETYGDLLPHSFEVEAFGVCFKCADLPTLIRIKEAADRPKDRKALAELRVLLEESEKKQV
jgi:hypothetical protein